MRNLPYYFLSVAIVQGIIGMGLGIWMAIHQDFLLAPAHAHNNLLGWVGMAIFGLYYAFVPSVAAQRLPMIHFWVALAGNIILPIGIGIVVSGGSEALSAVGSLIEVANMLLFGFIVWTNREALARAASR